MAGSDDNGRDPINPDGLQKTFVFDKFMDDLEKRERLRKEANDANPADLNRANRLRDARNREHAHNRIKWRR